ncbi:stalk domain-containing protein, partial [Paenibacillus alginolyticus]
MKSFCSGIIAGILICIFFVVGGSAYAEGSSKVDVFFRNIKIMFDGVEKKSAEGKVFVYENLTYVPLRFVSESLGKEVGWNEETQTVWIGTQESNNKEQAEQATKIINHGLENAEKLQSYSMKVNGSILVGDEDFKIGVETGLEASVIRKPEMIISGDVVLLLLNHT